MVSAERTSAGSPRGESISIVYTERHFCVAVRRTYSMGERVLGRFSGSGEGCGITLGRPIYHFIFFFSWESSQLWGSEQRNMYMRMGLEE